MTSVEPVKLKLYDTYSRQKQDFVPLDVKNVRIYACGPTVYDYAHIGNARPAIVFDVLFRLLRHLYGEEHVTYVRNITDVDDKINARAARDYPDLPLNQAIRKVTEATYNQYQKDVLALGCLPPTHQPRATEHIEEMIAMIAILIKNKNAYEAEGHVLFNVKSWKNGKALEYGKLSNRSLDDMIAGARVEVAPYKRDPMDFVLWKPSSTEEPGWDSPWGRGRPGWHIECSAMSEKYLGKIFDIHAGGIDLSFPHHENELAQSCCANGTDKMAQIWMHNGFLQVEGKKMSKSDGNFITIHELLETEKFGGHQWPGDVLRLAMLMTHYREPIDFSVARLEEASQVLARWKRAIRENGLTFEDAHRDEHATLEPCSKLVTALSNDLNMPGVIAELHRHAESKKFHNANRLFASLRLLGIVSFDSMQQWVKDQALREGVVDMSSGANGTLELTAGAPMISAGGKVQGVKSFIVARLEALAAKDFAKADQIRDELAAEGIQLMDYKDSETGERRTKWEMKR